ncbi:helix-turn-helix domain-containing protein [Leptobacterium flavescens]|uniref:Helix-turn-helix domain-containing protein n=1 Tax=Leptobacterium flavescens TaxID=472055 RepID=A0A6P0UPA8_9FLAO|nr:helix-turn-helix transcriptional regulator [Leptobacterium flavescens]NER13788.1 helix-turn-helix domain-containing protein [Leptobacterium flavescens]
MITSKDFAEKLQKIIEYYELSASAFAEKIGVQRSSISHLLSGRNKPSLDFIIKLSDTFSEVDLYWLLKDEGNFPSQKNEKPETEIQKPIEENTAEGKTQTEKKEFRLPPSGDTSISRIIIFYKDGRFDEYKN